jgi:hypothetical protein
MRSSQTTVFWSRKSGLINKHNFKQSPRRFRSDFLTLAIGISVSHNILLPEFAALTASAQEVRDILFANPTSAFLRSDLDFMRLGRRVQ